MFLLIRLLKSPLFLLFLMSYPCFAKSYPPQLDCVLGRDYKYDGDYEKLRFMEGQTQSVQGGDFTILMKPLNGQCCLDILDKNKKIVFESTSENLQASVYENQDGRLLAFIQTSSSNETYKMSLVELEGHPFLLKTIENKDGFGFQDDSDDGKIRLWTTDEAFEMDPEVDDIYHYEVFLPQVVLELSGNNLIDVTPKAKRYFDQWINNCLSEMTKKEILDFRNNRIENGGRRGDVKIRILGIALAYLYTDRMAEAKKTLDKMWPPADEQRIWEWILKKRSNGILRQTSGFQRNT